MRARWVVAGVILSLVVLGGAGCGSGDGHGQDDSPMDRCRGGRTMTVTDPAADNLISRPASDIERLAVLRPGSFDIRRATIATTDTMLCASVTFARRDRVLKPGQFTRRLITLEFVPTGPPPSDTQFLARLNFGGLDVGWVPYGATENDSDEGLQGEWISGSQGREVQLAVPVRELYDVAPALRSRGIDLDPRSFSWRISVASDCVPGARQLTTFPSGRRITLPGLGLSDFCR
ncbi:MAG: hypothetical protein ACRDKY_00510 [Solirubrobacteraceae bacterium]